MGGGIQGPSSDQPPSWIRSPLYGLVMSPYMIWRATPRSMLVSTKDTSKTVFSLLWLVVRSLDGSAKSANPLWRWRGSNFSIHWEGIPMVLNDRLIERQQFRRPSFSAAGAFVPKLLMSYVVSVQGSVFCFYI